MYTGTKCNSHVLQGQHKTLTFKQAFEFARDIWTAPRINAFSGIICSAKTQINTCICAVRSEPYCSLTKSLDTTELTNVWMESKGTDDTLSMRITIRMCILPCSKALFRLTFSARTAQSNQSFSIRQSRQTSLTMHWALREVFNQTAMADCLCHIPSRKHAYIILTPLNPTFI